MHARSWLIPLPGSAERGRWRDDRIPLESDRRDLPGADERNGETRRSSASCRHGRRSLSPSPKRGSKPRAASSRGGRALSTRDHPAAGLGLDWIGLDWIARASRWPRRVQAGRARAGRPPVRYGHLSLRFRARVARCRWCRRVSRRRGWLGVARGGRECCVGVHGDLGGVPVVVSDPVGVVGWEAAGRIDAAAGRGRAWCR